MKTVGYRKESETDAIERQHTVRVRSNLSPTVILRKRGGDEARTDERLLIL